MWIELHDSARGHPKFIKLARDLGIPRAHALGHMASLWLWTLRMAPDGDLSSFDIDDIEIGAEWEGEPGAFVAACRKRELLDETEHGLVVHDWEDFAAHLKAASRKREERKRKRSDKKKATVQDMSRDNPGNPDVSRDTPGKSGPVTGQARNSGPVTRTDRPTDRQTDRPNARSSKKQNSAPAVLELQLIPSHGVFAITKALIDEYVESFPGVDVMHELRKACQWARDNPARRKTKAGARKYLGNWLGRVQDRGRGQSGPAPPPKDRKYFSAEDERAAFSGPVGDLINGLAEKLGGDNET